MTVREYDFESSPASLNKDKLPRAAASLEGFPSLGVFVDDRCCGQFLCLRER